MNDEIKEFLNNNNEEDMDYMDYMRGLFSKINITEKEYNEFILNKINIMPGFKSFYNKAKSRNVPLAIISGGFINGIEPFLKKHNISDIKVYANEIIFNDKLELEFYHGNNRNCCKVKGCGNCKTKHYENFSKEYKNIIFIGDGITDKPIANYAEVVFARDSLLDYCIKNNIDYIKWNDFYEIEDILF